MAAKSEDLMEFVAQHKGNGEFQPYAYYGAEEDAITIYFKGDADYSRRCNSRVTVFFSLDGDELVGCRIKSLRHVLDDIGWFDLTLKHGRVRVDLLFLALRGEFADEPELRALYRRLGQEVSKTGVEVEVPETCTA